MAKPLPLSDHRALRHYLEPEDYGLPASGSRFVPTGRISPKTWSNLVGLSDSVAVETSDEFATELERVESVAWSWLDIHDKLAKNTPTQYQTLSALETFQASTFNALNGWYRVAGGCLRYALEDMLLGLYFQDLPQERGTFEAITDGRQGSPKIGTILRAFERAGLSQELSDATKLLYHEVLSVYVHLRSDGNIWESNGPTYAPAAFQTWLSEYETTYLIICELIDARILGTGALAIAQQHVRADFRVSPI